MRELSNMHASSELMLWNDFLLIFRHMLQVNTDNIDKLWLKTELRVERAPFFKIWVNGHNTHSFTCNLISISNLRRCLAEAASSSRPRTVFRSPSITEMPISSLLCTTAAAAAVAASANSPAGSFRERTERMRILARGPAGAVRGSGSRMPSIDDLVSHIPSPGVIEDATLEPSNTPEASIPTTQPPNSAQQH
jgi:hypothetical protein